MKSESDEVRNKTGFAANSLKHTVSNLFRYAHCLTSNNVSRFFLVGKSGMNKAIGNGVAGDAIMAEEMMRAA